MNKLYYLLCHTVLLYLRQFWQAPNEELPTSLSQEVM